MTPEEYRDFLTSVAKVYVRLSRIPHHPKEEWHFRHEIDQLSSLSRFSLVVAENHERVELYKPFGDALQYTHVKNYVLEQSGALEALDAHAEMIFTNLTRDVIPAEDIELLRRAGFHEAEAEITVVIRETVFRYSRRTKEACPSSMLQRADEELQHAAERLRETAPEPKETAKKPKKLFTGIARILGGGLMATGNVLAGVGIGPDKLLGSVATGVAMVGQGLGELRGES